MARCGAFSGTIRPHQTRSGPPGPGCHWSTSTPLRITRDATTWDQDRAVKTLTATNRARDVSISPMAGSSHGVGGVCSVVSMGAGTVVAMAIGR